MEPAADATEETRDAAIIVELTPRTHRRRAAFGIGGGLLLIAASVIDLAFGGQRVWFALYGIAALACGISSLRRARRQLTELVLRIDRSGIHSGDGECERRWDGVIMVWVGSQSGFRLPVVFAPVISVFTVSGLDFARRAGARPSPLYTLPVGGRHRVGHLCHRLRALSTAEIVDGTTVSRRAAAGALAGRL